MKLRRLHWLVLSSAATAARVDYYSLIFVLRKDMRLILSRSDEVGWMELELRASITDVSFVACC